MSMADIPYDIPGLSATCGAVPVPHTHPPHCESTGPVVKKGFVACVVRKFQVAQEIECQTKLRSHSPMATCPVGTHYLSSEKRTADNSGSVHPSAGSNQSAVDEQIPDFDAIRTETKNGSGYKHDGESVQLLKESYLPSASYEHRQELADLRDETDIPNGFSDPQDPATIEQTVIDATYVSPHTRVPPRTLEDGETGDQTCPIATAHEAGGDHGDASVATLVTKAMATPGLANVSAEHASDTLQSKCASIIQAEHDEAVQNGVPVKLDQRPLRSGRAWLLQQTHSLDRIPYVKRSLRHLLHHRHRSTTSASEINSHGCESPLSSVADHDSVGQLHLGAQGGAVSGMTQDAKRLHDLEDSSVASNQEKGSKTGVTSKGSPLTSQREEEEKIKPKRQSHEFSRILVSSHGEVYKTMTCAAKFEQSRKSTASDQGDCFEDVVDKVKIECRMIEKQVLNIEISLTDKR